MQAWEFIKRVKDRTGAQSDEKAHMYIDAVFSELRDRISIGGASNIAAQLPKELQDMWSGGMLHNVVHAIAGVEHTHLGEFLGHIQNKAHLADGDEAQRITRAVFSVLHEQITIGEAHAIANQLPEDIRNLWTESVESPEFYDSKKIGPAAAEVYRSDDQLREEIEHLLEINDEVDESSINVHVEQGTVKLSGSVRSELEKQAASRTAKHVLGVTGVQDDLEVRSEPRGTVWYQTDIEE